MSASDIMIAGATVWIAASGTDLPSSTSVLAGVAWGGGWTNIGYTSEPLTVNAEMEQLDAMIQQAIGAIKRVNTKEAWTFETSLAEFTMQNMLYIAGGTLATTAAGVGQVGYEDLQGGGIVNITERAFGFEGTYVSAAGNTHPLRLGVYKATGQAGGEVEVGKETQTGLPLTIKALQDLTKAAGKQFYHAYKVTAPAS